MEDIESYIWTVWWVKFGKGYWYQNLLFLVEEFDWLLKAIGSSCEGKWSQQGRTLRSTVVPRHSFFWFFTVMGIWCKILDTWVCPCPGKCVEQIPGSGLPAQWATRTWHLPDWLLTLHCPKSAPTVIPSISVSGCWDEELRVILDSIFVPCVTFNLSGNPMALPSIYIRELLLCYSPSTVVTHQSFSWSFCFHSCLSIINSQYKARLILLKLGRIMLFCALNPLICSIISLRWNAGYIPTTGPLHLLFSLSWMLLLRIHLLLTPLPHLNLLK